MWAELDGTLSGLSLSTYSPPPPEQLPRKPEGFVSVRSRPAQSLVFLDFERPV